MATDERDAEFIDRLNELKRYPIPGWAEDQLELIKHYGIYDEMYEYVMQNDGIDGTDVDFECVYAFRRKPDRVVWTEEEFREKVRTGEVSKYDVIQMADGYVPPQG